jgi:hypothetical protein
LLPYCGELGLYELALSSEGVLKILRVGEFMHVLLNQIDVLFGITFQNGANFRTFRRAG